jgi:hypothetical protein
MLLSALQLAEARAKKDAADVAAFGEAQLAIGLATATFNKTLILLAINLGPAFLYWAIDSILTPATDEEAVRAKTLMDVATGALELDAEDDGEISTADAINRGLVKPGETTGDIPVFVESFTATPRIAENGLTAQLTDHPSLLTYEPEYARARRDAATRPWGHLTTSTNNWLDEYPFATTAEGGPGAQVMAVPDWEQRIQGTTYSAFLAYNQMDGGEPFIVLVVP